MKPQPCTYQRFRTRRQLMSLLLLLTVTCSLLLPRPALAATPGGVIAWGCASPGDNYGQCTVPAGLGEVIAIAGGFTHTLALKSDGKVVGWGLNGEGQTTAPSDLMGVTAIAGGGYHSLALKNNGTVVGWGRNVEGQTTIPAGLSGVVAIAAGAFHSLALKNDGTVVGWGKNDAGQTAIPAGLRDVIAIAANDYHSLALKRDGTVVGWGRNDSGELTIPAGLNGVIAIAAGLDHTIALKNNGTVVAWGYGSSGRTTIPAGLSDVVAIAAGGDHNLALKRDGTVVAWGWNISGATTIPAGLNSVLAIAGGGLHSLALTRACYWIESKLTGYVLDVTGANPAPGTPVVVWPKNKPASANQLWLIDPLGGTIVSKLNGLFLDAGADWPAPGAQVVVNPKQPAPAYRQTWAKTDEGNGWSAIRAIAPWYPLDIRYGSTAKGAAIIVWPQNNPITNNQLWRVVQAPAAECNAGVGVAGAASTMSAESTLVDPSLSATTAVTESVEVSTPAADTPVAADGTAPTNQSNRIFLPLINQA